MRIVCICALALLGACTPEEYSTKFVEDEKYEAAAVIEPDTRPLVLGWKDERNGLYLGVIVDSQTGCEYISSASHGYNGGRSLTPRMNAKGVHVCTNPR